MAREWAPPELRGHFTEHNLAQFGEQIVWDCIDIVSKADQSNAQSVVRTAIERMEGWFGLEK